MSDSARRRAAALAGHIGDAGTARTALQDPSAAVRATAIGALARLRELTASELRAAANDADPGVRRRVAETAPLVLDAAAGLDLLRALLGDADATVVEVAAWACGEIPVADATTVDALCEIASGHEDALVREAAVAALGAIGHAAALPTILAAMADKPAIRRRAVLALAPFEGSEVDVALERATRDRDWQVRQAAEDLLT